MSSSSTATLQNTFLPVFHLMLTFSFGNNMASSLAVCEFLAAHDYLVSVHQDSDVVTVRVMDRVGGHSLFICQIFPRIRSLSTVLCQLPLPFTIQKLLSLLVRRCSAYGYSMLFDFGAPRLHYAARVLEMDLCRHWIWSEQIVWTRIRWQRLLQQSAWMNMGLYIVNGDEVPFSIDWAHSYRPG